jgi:hypothetical protein
MCGIVGILGREPVADLLVEALKRLEYRGYDSAGVATLENGRLTRRRAQGKLRNLEAVLRADPLSGTSGIGHTRWATHGRPTEVNAHPHATSKVAVVHNGIIENFRELRADLQARGHVFVTETDTEVVAHLVTDAMDGGLTPAEAVAVSLPRLRGAFALAFLFDEQSNLLIGARQGAPLAVGYGQGDQAGTMYLGSDALALAPFTDTLTYLEEGDWVVLTHDKAMFFDQSHLPVERKRLKTMASAFLVDKYVGRPGRSAFHFAGGRDGHRQADDHRLRDRLYGRSDLEILVRAVRPPAGHDRGGVGIPLRGRPDDVGRADDRRISVRRNGRYAGVAALRQGAGPEDPLRGQRPDLDHGPRKRCGWHDSGRTGNRCGLDKGLHLSACRPRLPCRGDRAAARDVERRR